MTHALCIFKGPAPAVPTEDSIPELSQVDLGGEGLQGSRETTEGGGLAGHTWEGHAVHSFSSLLAKFISTS